VLLVLLPQEHASVQLSSTIQQQIHIVVILQPIYFKRMRELEDRKWFPAFLRKHQTDYLAFLATTFKLYHPVKPILLKCLNNSSNTDWTDTCSGSGGPVKGLNMDHPVLLTDLFPYTNNHIPNDYISYHEKPVNILEDAIPGNGMISMFNAFHHFNQKEKRRILEKTKKDSRAIFIAEILQPDLVCFLRVLLSATVGHWLLVPFMKPFSIQRIIFTYIFPLHTLTVLIDGMISVFKAAAADNLRKLAFELSDNNYKFFFEAIPSFSSKLYVLYGRKEN
jgi:hypothetical protein